MRAAPRSGGDLGSFFGISVLRALGAFWFFFTALTSCAEAFSGKGQRQEVSYDSFPPADSESQGPAVVFAGSGYDVSD